MSKNKILLRLLGFIIAYLFIVGIFQFLGGMLSGMSLTEPAIMTSKQLFATVFGTFVGTVLLLYIFTKWIDKIKFVEIGLQTDAIIKDFFLGFLLGFLPIALGFVILWQLGIIHHVQVRFNFSEILLSFIIFLLVAFNEEAFMRGYILRNLMLAFHKYTALILSAILFALLHIFNDNINFIGLTNIFLAGILLGLPYIFTKNLWFPIGLHFAWNLTQTLFGFNVSGFNTYSVLSYQLSDKMSWLSGGAFGFEGSVLSLFFEVVLIVVVYFLFRKRHSVKIFSSTKPQKTLHKSNKQNTH